jgi:hypothetical protein
MTKRTVPTLPEGAAEKLLQADAANIIKKVKSGRPLSRAERTHLLAMASGDEEVPAPSGMTIAKNFVELAEALGVVRKTLYLWKRKKGAPKPATNGDHDVGAWRLFCRKNGLGGGIAQGETPPAGDGDSADLEDMERLKAKRLIVDIATREHALAVRRGEYVESATVAEQWAFHVGQAMTLLRSKLENELPPFLASETSAATIRVEMGRVVDEFARMLNEGGQ